MHKKVFHGLVFGLLFCWQLPQNLAALCILPFTRKVAFLTYRNYCFAFRAELPRKVGGVSLGSFALIDSSCAYNDKIIRHEVDGHTVDSKIFGPLYLLIIGFPSALHFLLHKNGDYHDFYTERLADRHAGLR